MEKGSVSKGAHYKYGQIFGYKGPGEKILEEDIISVVKFDQTGRFLALGDNAGRVIVFQSEAGSKGKD
jgi:serine/threonine-protein phosphatase 2A regulatory subunit B